MMSSVLVVLMLRLPPRSTRTNTLSPDTTLFRSVPDSLAATMDWFMTWVDAEGDPERPVILVGFSGGAAFAGGLMLSRPERSEEHTSELQTLMRNSYAVFCLKNKNN